MFVSVSLCLLSFPVSIGSSSVTPSTLHTVLVYTYAAAQVPDHQHDMMCNKKTGVSIG
jgi:hypothetical protein